MLDPNFDSMCDSDSSASLKPSRNKAWMPKVKTGCVTCKARRIKCDEEKPSCHRCIMAGRECKGYPSPEPKVKGIHWYHWKPQKAGYARLVPKGRAMSEYAVANPKPEAVLETAWTGSSREKRSFHYFLTVMPSELSGLFTDTAFWSYRVAQASAQEPAIRHLLIAFAAAHEQYAWSRLEKGKAIPSEERERFVLEQCNSSIKHLLALASTTAENPADSRATKKERWRGRVKLILAALLFTYIAQLQNNRSDALRHLQGGLKLLSELEEDQAAFEFAEKDPQCLIPMSGMRCLFQMLNVQARVLRLMGQDTSWDNQWPAMATPPPDTSPRPYERLKDAQDYCQVLYSNHLNYLERCEVPSHLEPSLRAQNEAAELASLRTALTWSFDAFNALVAQSSPETLKKDALRIKHTQLYHTLLDVWVKAANKDPHTASSDFEVMQSQMKDILAYCEDLKALEIDPEPLKTKDGRPLFCPGGPGVVLPLYLISIWSYDPVVREQAVDMLVSFPRCEGLWDGALAARTAVYGIPLEEPAVDPVTLGLFPVLPMYCVPALELEWYEQS